MKRKSPQNLETYKQHIQEKIADISALFENAARGDFSKKIEVPQELNEFTGLYEKARLALTTLEDKMSSLQKCNIDLERSVNGLTIKRKRIKKTAQQKLEDAVISNFGEGMLVIDKLGGVDIINQKAREMLGYDRSESLKGRQYHDVLRFQDRFGRAIPPGLHPIDQTFSTGQKSILTLSHDVYSLRKDGEIFPVTLSVSPVMMNKKLKKAIVILYNVTEEKRIDEIKTDFISIASHQLRTPLTVSTLHAEMLLAGHAGELSAEQREYIHEIYFYNKKMVDLLNVFLTVSKIDLQNISIEAKPADIRSILDQLLVENALTIRQKRLHIEKKYDTVLPIIYIDPIFVRTIFQNILSNSIKYTPQGGHIVISAKRKGKDVAVTIQDDGCGIPAKEHSKVFTKLYRGTNAKKRDWDGTGLGLYISKAIIDRCGGNISFTSKENKGTTFFVSLPKKSAQYAAAAAKETTTG